MKVLKKFVNYKVIVLSLVSFFLVDQVGGALILRLFQSAKSGIALKERVIFFETNEDILFLGSSRAAFHYVPEIFEEKLNLSSYNAGREGTGIFFHYAILIATLERYKPKMIILDVDFRDVYDRGGDFGENVFGQLRPYYGLINDEFDRYITRKPYDYLFNQSKLLRFNKKFLNILSANLSSSDKTFMGFKPLTGTWNGINKTSKDENFKFSEEHLNQLEKFIIKAIDNDINLVLVSSPTNKIVPNKFFKIVQEMCSKHKVSYFDFSHHDETMHREFFYDLEHLNLRGAEKFSELLADSLIRHNF